jgi:hypothetical protein
MENPTLWIPAEQYAAERGLEASEVVSRIIDGALPGRRDRQRWYVARPPVMLHFPDPANLDVAELRLLAFSMGRYLTEGRTELTIPLHRTDPDRDTALNILLDALQGPPPDPPRIKLAGHDWCVDSSLQLDLTGALIEFEVVHDSRALSRHIDG